ncbi:21170_t:CDS:2 [Entrophospora sp. SA101]|nr:21170_t:CDS:2 [Entrophospora sp. SA101]
MLDIFSDTKSKSIISTIQIYAVGEHLKKTITHYTWWTTAITICYLRLHASFHKTIWEVHYGKARKYLGEQIKNEELEEELLKACYNQVSTTFIKINPSVAKIAQQIMDNSSSTNETKKRKEKKQIL